MLRHELKALLLAVAILIASPVAAAEHPLVILNYHHIATGPEPSWLTISPERLREQIREARSKGWTFLSLSEVLSRLEGDKPLPGPVMVLTFDDGYRSFLDLALPVLEEEKVPATLAIVGSFVTNPPPEEPPILSWDQIRRLAERPTVEIVSHSQDLHRWIANNPFGDTSPAATTRHYRAGDERYEHRSEYLERLRTDLSTAREGLRDKLGREVSVLVWPFGQHNAAARRVAAEVGFSWTFSLGDRAVGPDDVAARVLPRFLVTRQTRVPDPALPEAAPAREIRMAQVDLDTLFDENQEWFRNKLDQAASRIVAAGATHVILQTCADPRGNGKLSQAWFMNHQLPVRADVFATAVGTFHRAGLKVWARAPVINLAWEWSQHPEWRIPKDPRLPRHDAWYYRVSPDLPQVQQAARDFYADLAVYAPIDGILFDDDAYMLSNEQLASSGVTDPTAKSEAMHALIRGIMETVRTWRPDARFGRSLYAPAAQAHGVHPMFAQDPQRFADDYDVTVVLAYAYREGGKDDPTRWIQRTVRKTLRQWPDEPDGSLLFKLQTYDWEDSRWLSEREIRDQIARARRAGASHVGVYPVAPEAGPLPEGLLLATPGKRSKR